MNPANGTPANVARKTNGLMSRKMKIEARAAARVLGMDYRDFVRRCVTSGIEAAQTRCWCRKLPFTRREETALARDPEAKQNKNL